MDSGLEVFVQIGVNHTAVVRYDFGGYGYSSVTNAVLYNEKDLISKGMTWTNIITGGYRGDVLGGMRDMMALQSKE